MSVFAGLKVIELANERSMFAGKLLADMGADVILIEPPGGDRCRGYQPFHEDQQGINRSLYFWHYNTSKRGIVLNLEVAEDLEVAQALIAGADVVIESEPLGRLAGKSLDYPQTSAGNSRLIHCSITPYGRDDLTFEADVEDARAFGIEAGEAGEEQGDGQGQ